MIALLKISPQVLAIPHRLADRRFQELIEDAPDAIVQVDNGGLNLIVHRTAEKMFGYSRDELFGSNVDLLIPEANRAAHSDSREHFMKSEVARPMGRGMGNLNARRKDAIEFSVEIALSPVKAETGVGTTAVIRDVTDRKQIEQELEQERAQRTQRIEILARLSSSLAHEIKNPLAIIHARASDLADLASEAKSTAHRSKKRVPLSS